MKSGKSNLFILGYFGNLSDQLDGQTIKTRHIHKLIGNYKKKEIPFFDTESLRKNPLSLIPAIFRIIKSQKLIYLPAQRNLRWFLPVLVYLSKIFRFKIYYIVVGGWLPIFIEKNPQIYRYLKRIEHIFVETEILRQNLDKNYKLKRVSILPNFRITNFRYKVKERTSTQLKCVFMSRINKLKGFDYIFDFADSTDKEIFFDFFGPIDKADEQYFMNKINTCSRVRYSGILQPGEIYDKLYEYDVFVFPTKYYTEGLPGAVVDAFISGLPVIASDWAYAREFIEEYENGFIFPFENGYERFEYYLNLLYEDPEMLQKMKFNAHLSSKKFSHENAWTILSEHID